MPKETEPDTKLKSLQLFKSGKTMAEIAAVRGLVVTTIEGHLAHYVLDGSINIKEIVAKKKIPLIAKAIKQHGDEKLGFLKAKLGDGVSYGEIRAVINYLKLKKR